MFFSVEAIVICVRYEVRSHECQHILFDLIFLVQFYLLVISLHNIIPPELSISRMLLHLLVPLLLPLLHSCSPAPSLGWRCPAQGTNCLFNDIETGEKPE